jgi:hypothetical protein
MKKRLIDYTSASLAGHNLMMNGMHMVVPGMSIKIESIIGRSLDKSKEDNKRITGSRDFLSRPTKRI